jgi:hypothetical protein
MICGGWQAVNPENIEGHKKDICACGHTRKSHKLIYVRTNIKLRGNCLHSSCDCKNYTEDNTVHFVEDKKDDIIFDYDELIPPKTKTEKRECIVVKGIMKQKHPIMKINKRIRDLNKSLTKGENLDDEYINKVKERINYDKNVVIALTEKLRPKAKRNDN